MLIDPKWIHGVLPWDAKGVVLVPAWCPPEDRRKRKWAQASSNGGRDDYFQAVVWSADNEDGESLDAADFATLDEAKAWCVQRLRELGHTFVGDPTPLELAERIAVLESLVYAMQMRGSHEK
jgi:hypothetical protein